MFEYAVVNVASGELIATLATKVLDVTTLALTGPVNKTVLENVVGPETVTVPDSVDAPVTFNDVDVCDVDVKLVIVPTGAVTETFATKVFDVTTLALTGPVNVTVFENVAGPVTETVPDNVDTPVAFNAPVFNVVEFRVVIVAVGEVKFTFVVMVFAVKALAVKAPVTLTVFVNVEGPVTFTVPDNVEVPVAFKALVFVVVEFTLVMYAVGAFTFAEINKLLKFKFVPNVFASVVVPVTPSVPPIVSLPPTVNVPAILALLVETKVLAVTRFDSNEVISPTGAATVLFAATTAASI